MEKIRKGTSKMEKGMWWRVVERSEGGIKWRREQELRGMTLRLGTDSDSKLVQPEPIQNRKTHGTRLSKPRSRVKQYLGLGATHTASLGGTERKQHGTAFRMVCIQGRSFLSLGVPVHDEKYRIFISTSIPYI